MWMMGCNDDSDLNSYNSCNGRKLRQLVPRPATNSLALTHSASCFNRNQLNEPLALLVQLESAHEKAAGLGTHPPVMSSRWNPTPKQLETLEDIYRRGTRTPTAEEIQQITYQLRKFGKIEGKNVFYWFQNHKARERQKRRRRLEVAEREIAESSDKKLSEFHVEGTRSSQPPTNCKRSITAQESVSVSRSTPESTKDRQDHLSQCDNPAPYDQQGRATWKLAHSSSPRYHLANVSPSTSTTDYVKPINVECNVAMDKIGEPRTLELFPLHSDHHTVDEKASQIGATLPIDLGSPFQFFHFLPLKN